MGNDDAHIRNLNPRRHLLATGQRPAHHAAAACVLALMEQHKVDWQTMKRAEWYPPDRVDVWEVVR